MVILKSLTFMILVHVHRYGLSLWYSMNFKDKVDLNNEIMITITDKQHCKNSGAGVTPKCPKPWCCCYTMMSHEHYGVV